ncbi:hypothetical protein [Aeromicrobium sp.]|uniref:hypothetical protein n=1 Tax=Aeromicrobium sp. TaxID=1871063 RepID=UPI002FCAECAD
MGYPTDIPQAVATLIDDHYSDPDNGGVVGAGAPLAAAVLGHSSETVTRAFYIKKMRNTPDVSDLLQNALAAARPAS